MVVLPSRGQLLRGAIVCSHYFHRFYCFFDGLQVAVRQITGRINKVFQGIYPFCKSACTAIFTFSHLFSLLPARYAINSVSTHTVTICVDMIMACPLAACNNLSAHGSFGNKSTSDGDFSTNNHCIRQFLCSRI